VSVTGDALSLVEAIERHEAIERRHPGPDR
jgi:hypothetical protein